MSGTQILLVGVIVLITHALEGITGFGCTVLALPFVATVLGLDAAVPVLTALAWLLAAYIVTVSRKKIVWKEFRFIAVYVGLGLPLGMLLFHVLPKNGLKGLLALFMVGIGTHGFCKTRHDGRAGFSAHLAQLAVQKNRIMRWILFLGGVIHGAFAAGGPFVVIYASKALPDKSLFRVSLCLLWLVMNTVLLIKFTLLGTWTPELGTTLLVTLPFLAAGMLFGDFMHRRVHEYYFRLIVYTVLFVSGVVLAYSLV